MAGDWTKIRNDIEDDPAVIYMAKALKIDTDHCVGKLRRIWAWADQQTRDGRIDFVTEDEVDRRASVALFARHMAHVGWLIIGDGFIEFPKWDTHNSNSAKSRAGNSKRQQKSRECRAHCATNARQKRDQRREEKSIDVAKATSCDGPAEPPQSEKPCDEIWDAVQGLWFPSGVPPSQRSRIGKIVRDLKSIGASIEAIYERQKRMRDEWGDKGNTPESMVKHWDFFGPDRKAQGNSSSLFGKASTEADSPARIRAAPGKYANIKPINSETNGKDGG